MTIEEFNELKVGDKVMYGGEVHTVDYCNGSNKHIIDVDGYGTIIGTDAAPNLTVVEKKENKTKDLSRREHVGRPVVHIKTGHIYFLMNKVLDCTNGREDTEMILYMNEEGVQFVREEEEFWKKFIPLRGLNHFTLEAHCPENQEHSMHVIIPAEGDWVVGDM